LVRDGRDVMVSYMHFQNARWNDRRERLWKFKCPISQKAVSWGEHVAAWLENPHRANIHFLRYESLLNDTVAELRKLCAFFQVSPPEEALRSAVERCSFDKLQNRERVFARNDGKRSPTIFRRGQVGSYRDELPESILAEFEARHGSLLDQFGYDRSATAKIARELQPVAT